LLRDDGHITKGSYVFNIQYAAQQQLQKINAASQKNNVTFSDEAVVDKANLQLEITPLYIGQNTFNVTIYQ
jgi:hypothetical protein